MPASRHLFIGDLIQLDVQLEIGLEIRFIVNGVAEGACLLVTRCNFSCQLCPLDTPLHMYIFYEINETHELFLNLCSFHSLYNTGLWSKRIRLNIAPTSSDQTSPSLMQLRATYCRVPTEFPCAICRVGKAFSVD